MTMIRTLCSLFLLNMCMICISVLYQRLYNNIVLSSPNFLPITIYWSILTVWISLLGGCLNSVLEKKYSERSGINGYVIIIVQRIIMISVFYVAIKNPLIAFLELMASTSSKYNFV